MHVKRGPVRPVRQVWRAMKKKRETIAHILFPPFPQGENGDLKNRTLKVEINLADKTPAAGASTGGACEAQPDLPDSSIGEGMDITIQGANGHVKRRLHSTEGGNATNEEAGETGSLRSQPPHPGGGDSLRVPDDHSIGRGMDISIRGDGEPQGDKQADWSEKEPYNGDADGVEVLPDGEKADVASSYSDEEEEERQPLPGKNVEEVLYDPVDEVVVEKCCPDVCYRISPCCLGDPDDSPFWHLWYRHRLQVSRLIENQYFESVVLALILLSSFVMTLEDVWFDTRPLLVDTLYYLDRILTVVFFLETSLKLFAMGCVMYFGNAWCWLDFVIVAVSLINFGASLFGSSNIPIFKTMRTLRALRPLRAMAKMEGMKVVVNALVGALPSIFNVLLVCLIFWLIFAIIGVNYFRGKFFKCVDPTGNKYSHEIIPNRTVCLSEPDAEWLNSRITYDNVLNAYLALFQVATFKGWIDIMNDAIDSRKEWYEQPFRENHVYYYIYFVLFIVFGAFFTLNLLVGVIIDKFNEQKNKGGSSLDAFMTEDQKKVMIVSFSVPYTYNPV